MVGLPWVLGQASAKLRCRRCVYWYKRTGAGAGDGVWRVVIPGHFGKCSPFVSLRGWDAQNSGCTEY